MFVGAKLGGRIKNVFCSYYVVYKLDIEKDVAYAWNSILRDSKREQSD